MSDEKVASVVRGIIGLECGGGGPNDGESSQAFTDRLATRITDALRRNGCLAEAA